MKTNIVIIVGVSLAMLLSVYYYTRPPKNNFLLPFYQFNESSGSIEQYDRPSENLHRVSFYGVLNQNGDTVNTEIFKDNLIVADFFFVTCPGICKEMGKQMKRINATIKDVPELRLLSFTSKPDEDSLPVLRNYAAQMGVDKQMKWQFLWSDEKNIYEIAKNQMFIADSAMADQFVHTERFVLIDKNKFIRGYYNGTDAADIDRLMKDIYKLKEE